MPFRPSESLLNLNLEKMHTIDTRSVEDLHGLWNVFSKTSNALKDGKRLENMSWRLWNRETFCCCPESRTRAPSLATARDSSKASTTALRNSIPDLASSIDTASGDEHDASADAIHVMASPSCHIVRPELTRLESLDSRNRGSQKHISPVALENLVNNIQNTSALEPIDDLELPALNSPLPELIVRKDPNIATAIATPPQRETLTRGATTQNHSQRLSLPPRTATVESSTSTIPSEASDVSAEASGESSSTAMSTHHVVRGFVPGGAPSSYRSQTSLAQPTPILKNSASRNAADRARAKGAFFTLGASVSEEESSLDSHLYKNSLGSLSEALPEALPEAPQKRIEKKTASFNDNNLVSRIQDSPVFDSDEDDDDDLLDEDVIDDDDSDDGWEDEVMDDRFDQEETVFQRNASRPTLTSRRSLLTTLMSEGDRAKALQNAASRSTPAMRRAQTTPSEGLSRATSGTASPAVTESERLDDMSGSTPRPIARRPNSIAQQLAFSPRTTRRLMLQSELTESLRRNLLWERQHRSSHNLAALKRRHTSHDVKNLHQYPDPQPGMRPDENVAKFNNDFFHAGLGEYNSKGW